MADLVRVTLHNRANGDEILSSLRVLAVPRVGELIRLLPASFGNTGPFMDHAVWRVDEVLWEVSEPGSMSHRMYSQDTGIPLGGDGLLLHADLLVWPERGPFWSETPTWAQPEVDDG